LGKVGVKMETMARYREVYI